MMLLKITAEWAIFAVVIGCFFFVQTGEGGVFSMVQFIEEPARQMHKVLHDGSVQLIEVS